MKKYILSGILIFVFCIVKGQYKITEETDEFTKVKRYDMDLLWLGDKYTSLGYNYSVIIKQPDTSFYLTLVFFTKELISVDSLNNIYLKLSNDEVIKSPIQYGWGIHLKNELVPVMAKIEVYDFDKLINNSVTKIRIETNKKNYDFDIPNNKSQYFSLGINQLISHIITSIK